MDVEIPVLSGYLIVPTQSAFSLNRISKRKPCQRYCLLFTASRHGIERLEICESKEDKNPKIITLENCVKITQESSPANLIQVVKKTGTLTLNTLTDEDLKEWLNALQTVAFRDKNDSHAAIEEDNDLYCSSFGDGKFIITLIPSDTSRRCNIDPRTYMLHISSTELQLKSVEDSNIGIATWPYRFIRKYGYRDGKFTFEAGRKCTTGEGIFTLDHSNPQDIFRCMSAKMKSMKKLIHGDSLNIIECGENQLNVAASMEAGSRSPLPPSPSNQHVTEFEINSTPSCMSMRGFISSTDSLNNFVGNNINTSNTPQSKNIPNKPPRKLPSPLDKISSIPCTAAHTSLLDLKCSNHHSCESFQKFQNYEPVSITTSIDPNKTVGSTVILKPSSPELLRNANIPPDLPVRNESNKPAAERDYESISTITEAWKTLGVGEVKHTERIGKFNKDDEIVDFVCQRSLSQREKTILNEPIKPTKVSKIIDIDIGEGGSCNSAVVTDATYDRLDFLSPNNKTSSGYKTIVTVTSPVQSTQYSQALPNDYELIASPEIQPFRKADDSFLGYGVVRKSSNSLIKLNSTISANNSFTASPSNGQTCTNTPRTINNIELPLDHRSYNGLNYTIVSKPKRV